VQRVDVLDQKIEHYLCLSPATTDALTVARIGVLVT
jgi:hypothetical protein